jgi:hypothetical protein
MASTRVPAPCLVPGLPAAGRLLLAAAAAAAVLQGACSKRPEKPPFDNPFGPGSGDPFRLTARYTASGIALSWERPPVGGLVSYDVQHSLQSGAGFDRVGQVQAGDRTSHAFVHTGFARNRTNYYKLIAVRDDGGRSLESAVAATPVEAPPELVIRDEDGDGRSESRHVWLELRSDRGDTVEIAPTSDFAAASRCAIAAGTTEIAWDLGPADSLGTVKYVWARVRDGAEVSPAMVDSATADFAPTIQLASGTAVIDTLVAVRVSAVGWDSVQLARSSADLPGAPWFRNPASSDSLRSLDVGFVLRGGALAPQAILSRIVSDFGFDRRDSLAVVPAAVGTPAFTLDGGALVTTDTRVAVVSTTPNASEMRFSESPSFTGVPWVAFRDTTEFVLSSSPGTKTVYGIFRNAFEPAGKGSLQVITLLVD